MFLLPFEVLGFFAIHCHEGGKPCVPAKAPAEDVMDIMAKLECAEPRPDDACKQLIKDSEEKFNSAVIALINVGGDVDQRGKMDNSRPNTPLMVAVFMGHTDIVKTLLKNGANPDIQNHEGNGPIHFAVRKNDPQLVEALIDAGADMNLPGWQTFTPLHLTAKHNLPAMTKILIEKGADLNPRSVDKGYMGYGKR